MSLNCWLIFDITLSLHQAPNYHHKHPPSLFPSPPHSFRSSSHAPWSTVLGHRLCPSWSLSVTVPSWDDPWPYSPHFPTCQPNLQPLCSPSLLGQPQPQGSPIPTPLNGRAPQAHFPLASTFHTPAWMPWSPVPHQVELRLLSEHPEATWYWERVWAPESDGLVSFLISDPWQVLLTSTSFPQR